MTDSASTSQPNPRVDMDAKLQAEIEAALGDMSLDDMLDMADEAKPARSANETRIGRVVNVHGDQVFVEFGPKSQGICPLAHFPEMPALGERLEFVVQRYDKDEGLLILSRQGAVQKAEWESLGVGQTVEAMCTGMNKGGLEMMVANHKAFMPAGQVDLRHLKDISVFLSQKMVCEVLELDRRSARIILSRKAHQQRERAAQREQVLATLAVGQTVTATITSLQAYGAFADLGGVDGLIHISDLSYDRIKHPSEVVQEGQQVEVRVLKIDRKQDPPRIGLGLKQLMENPVAKRLAEIREGEAVTGKVTKLMPFGAFIELAPGLEGLVHISELSHDRVQSVGQVLKPNEVVTVKVLSVDPRSKKVALSLKALQEKKEAEMERREDKHMRKLKAQLTRKFGELKGGIG
jgi:small subunit ribosomal protein S1